MQCPLHCPRTCIFLYLKTNASFDNDMILSARSGKRYSKRKGHNKNSILTLRSNKFIFVSYVKYLLPSMSYNLRGLIAFFLLGMKSNDIHEYLKIFPRLHNQLRSHLWKWSRFWSQPASSSVFGLLSSCRHIAKSNNSRKGKRIVTTTKSMGNVNMKMGLEMSRHLSCYRPPVSYWPVLKWDFLSLFSSTPL